MKTCFFNGCTTLLKRESENEFLAANGPTVGSHPSDLTFGIRDIARRRQRNGFQVSSI